MSIICYGPNGQGPFEQRLQIEGDPRLGTESTRTFVGTFAQLLPLLQSFQANGWSFRIGPIDGQNFILTAKIGATYSSLGLTDDPVPQWEFVSNKIVKDLLDSNIPFINGLSSGEIQAIRAATQNPTGVEPTIGQPWSTASGAPDVSSNGKIAFDLIMAGDTGVQIFAPTMRSTVTTSNIYTVTQSFGLTGTLLKSSTISTYLPTVLALTLPLDGGWTNSNGTVFYYGWLVDAPNIVAAAFSKTSVVQEYQWGLWPQVIYGTPS